MLRLLLMKAAFAMSSDPIVSTGMRNYSLNASALPLSAVVNKLNAKNLPRLSLEIALLESGFVISVGDSTTPISFFKKCVCVCQAT